MSSYTGLSPKNPNKYTGPVNFISSVVTRNRRPTSADYRQPETGKIYPTSSFWLVGPEPTTGIQGELWYLSKVVANVAYWVQLNSGGGSTFSSLDVPLGVTTIVPDGLGTITFTSTGGTVNITGSAADPNNNFVNFDLSGGLPPVNQITVDDFDAPGVNPVIPTAGGEFTFTGEIVANQMIPIQTYTNAANEFAVQTQYAASSAVSNSQVSGMCHFDDSMFNVDAGGFVQLADVSLSINTLGVQATSGTGTDPVVPDGAGNVELEGALVAAGTNPLRAVSTAANTVQYQLQTSQALASSDATKVGACNFNNTQFSVDSNGFVSVINDGAKVGVVNLGITYSAGTFTITGSQAALSSTNPAYVTLQSKTPGRVVTIAVTADQSFIDDAGASTIIGNLFGLTTGVAASNAIPFFIYAVLNDAENAISFMISRYPNTKVSPVAAKIGKTGSAIADTQGSFFALDNPTVADYEQNPCLSIGSFRMTMSASDDWTVSALTISDGIGNFQENVKFNSIAGQFGAASGKYFYNNGGTAPAFNNNFLYYFVNRNNIMLLSTGFSECTTAGVGGGTLHLAAPYSLDMGAVGSGRIKDTGSAIYVGSCSIVSPGPNNQISMWRSGAGASINVINSTITLGFNYTIDYCIQGFIDFA